VVWRALTYATLCALSAGCTMVVYQTDDFPYRLRRGCESADDCDRLVTEAKTRVSTCEDGTSGKHVACSDANKDLAVATDLAQAKRARGLNNQPNQPAQRDGHDVASQQAETEPRKSGDDAATHARDAQEAAKMRQEQTTNKAGQKDAFSKEMQDAAKRAQQAEAERKTREAEEAERERQEQQRERDQKKTP